ncbi:MAG: aspartate kinase [Acidobacteriota bacterium]
MTAFCSPVPVSLDGIPQSSAAQQDSRRPATPGVRVLKFGGTSLDGPPRLRNAGQIIRQTAAGQRLVVVVSAMAGITDTLSAAIEAAENGETPEAPCDQLIERHIACSRELLDENARSSYENHLCQTVGQLRRWLDGVRLLGECPPVTHHRILACGERLCAPLLAALLRCIGRPAKVFDGQQLIAIQPASHGRIDLDETRRRAQTILGPRPDGEVAVVTGFTASDATGRTTTLGRGTSDYSATLLAAALDACEVQIWTDVDGVLSIDPKLTAEASPLNGLSYDEATYLAELGAEVLHPKAIAPLAARKIPLRIRNSLRPDRPGTLVNRRDASRTNRAVTTLPEVVRFRLRPSEPRRLLDSWLLSACPEPPLLLEWETSGRSVSVVVRQADAQRFEKALRPSLRNPTDLVLVERQELALIATLGPLGALFSALEGLTEQGIEARNLNLPDASRTRATLLVERSELRRAARYLHRSFLTGFDTGRADSGRADACQPPLYAVDPATQAAQPRDLAVG